MSDNDHNGNSPRQKPEHLLDELEAIKGVLTNAESSALIGDIPLLDDMVIAHLDDNARLLNLHRVFEEDIDAEFDFAESESVDNNLSFPRFQLDVTISDDDVDIAPASIAATNLIPTAIPSPPPLFSPNLANNSRDQLIQQLVDEFAPQIEAALRQRLAKLDIAALLALKNK